MTLSRRAFLAALAATSNATVAHAQRTAAPVDEALFALAGSCILGGSRERMLHPTLASMLGRGALAGIIVGSENVRNLTELRATLDAVRARVGSAAPPALVAADQEGGSVSHLSPMLPRMP